MKTTDLNILLKKCLKGERRSQKELYKHFYNYGMTVCMHYTANVEEAGEVLNDGFFKVFKNLDRYNFNQPFKAWFRRILINSSIDYYRKYKTKSQKLEVVHLQYESSNYLGNLGEAQLSLDDVMNVIQKLTPAYKMVFNLYVVEGYKHHEIAERLNISVGASKSNLAKAKMKLRELLKEYYPHRKKAQ